MNNVKIRLGDRQTTYTVIPSALGWFLREHVTEDGAVIDLTRSPIVAWDIERSVVQREHVRPDGKIYRDEHITRIAWPICDDFHGEHYMIEGPDGVIRDNEGPEFKTVEEAVKWLNEHTP